MSNNVISNINETLQSFTDILTGSDKPPSYLKSINGLLDSFSNITNPSKSKTDSGIKTPSTATSSSSSSTATSSSSTTNADLEDIDDDKDQYLDTKPPNNTVYVSIIDPKKKKDICNLSPKSDNNNCMTTDIIGPDVPKTGILDEKITRITKIDDKTKLITGIDTKTTPGSIEVDIATTPNGVLRINTPVKK
jgi:N-acetylmuramoyl-L-alanine amidase CwlA